MPTAAKAPETPDSGTPAKKPLKVDQDAIDNAVESVREAVAHVRDVANSGTEVPWQATEALTAAELAVGNLADAFTES